MKKTLALLLCGTVLCAAAADRNALLKKFNRENAEVDKVLNNAMTTIDITAAAGFSMETAKKQLIRALDYKLRCTQDPQKRYKLLQNFHDLSREVRKILDTPRENMGSSAGMNIYFHAANLMQQQLATLMLDSEAEKRWQRIAHAPITISGDVFQMKNGKCDFATVMYDQKTELQILLFPQDTFTFNKRDFAVIRSDKVFAMNSDYSTVYLYELKKGTLTLFAKCSFPFLESWKLEGNNCILTSGRDKKEILKINLTASK